MIIVKLQVSNFCDLKIKNQGCWQPYLIRFIIGVSCQKHSTNSWTLAVASSVEASFFKAFMITNRVLTVKTLLKAIFLHVMQ